MTSGFDLAASRYSPPMAPTHEPLSLLTGGTHMGADDKASNKIDDLGGKAKEGLGKLTGDKGTENEGKFDQAKSSIKDAGEKIKDAFKN